MRKLLCFFLTSFLCLSLCACGGENTTSSDASDGESSAPDTSGTEESNVSEVFVENELIAQIDACMSGIAPDRTMLAKNLLTGATYTYNTETNESYADPYMSKLTDGSVRDVFDNYSWVAFKGSVKPTVTFDLGDKPHELADLEIHMLRQTSYGIELPSAVSVSVSADGETFTTVSTLQTPTDIAESGQYTYRFAFPQTIGARYIRVTLTRKNDTFLFLDEVTGYEYCEDGTIDVSAGESSGDEGLEYDYYNYALLTDITTPVSSSDQDYNTRQNLALLDGAEVQAAHFDPLDLSYLSGNSPAGDLAKLTDGEKAAQARFSDPAYVKFYRGCGRHIVVDLGNEMAVDEVQVDFLNQVSAGVGAPPAVMIGVSNDGENWVTTHAEYTGLYGDSVLQSVQIVGTFKQAYRCRYVRVSFCTVPDNNTTSSVYVSELEVYGTKNAENIPAAEFDDSLTYGRYPDAEAFGAENILLAAISGYAGESDYSAMDEESALIHLAYLDKDGNILDTFFDSVMFAPTGKFPFQTDAKESFDLFADITFADGQNLPAMNSAATTLLGAIPTAEKPTVWLNLMCPHTGETCSDVNGDGIAEDFSNAEGRFAYLKYQVDTYLEKWTAAGYENLELLGFYWNDETLHKSELALETAVIKQINDYIHSLGYKNFWCPYYNSYGYWMWQEIGFDFASLQPNYMFYATESTRLSSAADTALIYGMGVELEIEDAVSAGSVGLYQEYLREGYDSGFMNSVKLYYHGGMPGAITRACFGEGGQDRAIYDDTYLLAKRKLDSSYNVSTAGALDGFTDLTLEVKHGKTVEFSLGDTSEYTVRILQSTVYGTFRLDLCGDGVYKAMKNFRGTDTIVLEIVDGVGNTKTVTLTVTVTE